MLAHLLKGLIAFEIAIAVVVGLWLDDAFGWPPAAAGVAGIACGLLPHLLLITLQFVLSAPYRSPLPESLKPQRRSILMVWLREMRESLRAFEGRQAFLGGRLLPSAPAPGREGLLPVLFVHGFVCNRAVWRPFAKALAQRGHVIGSVNLEPVFGSIDDFADRIEDSVRELCHRTGHDQVALVCHSMGGLAARAYLRAHGDLAVARVITLATPHRGTRIAQLGFGRNARQMRFDSDWLQQLAAGEQPERRRLFTIVFSHDDNIVAPQALQVLEGAETIARAGVGHMAILADPAVQQQVAERLQTRSP